MKKKVRTKTTLRVRLGANSNRCVLTPPGIRKDDQRSVVVTSETCLRFEVPIDENSSGCDDDVLNTLPNGKCCGRSFPSAEPEAR